MKAAVYRGPGAVSVEDYPDPADPGPGELTLEISRAAICGTDASEWRHGPLLARPPVVLGHEFTGTVVATGGAATESGAAGSMATRPWTVGPGAAGAGAAGFAPGDRVVCGAGVSCGQCEWCMAGRTNLCASYRTFGLHVNGGLAQYVTVPQAICLPVPGGVTATAAAMAQPLAVALHAVRRSGLRPGQSCAVIGAGGIGAFIVAAAAAAGASPLIALDIDEDRLQTARTLGAATVIDARGRDLDAAILQATGGEGADVVIEASGTPGAPAAATRAARRGGRVLIVGLQAAPRELDLLSLTVREVEITTTLAHVCDVDLPEALALLERSELAPAVTERVIALDDLVAHGIEPLAGGTARGKIVVAP
jgi:(R,R)-butanediol dehydrogenase / meso-butanediol dehydrogenase / diacetyl reductase